MDELPNGTVTLLFTDIEGSTHLLQREGEDKTNMLETCRLLRAMFQQFHGHEVDYKAIPSSWLLLGLLTRSRLRWQPNAPS